MIKDLTPEEAGRWMDAAPQIVQDALTSPDTIQKIDDIAKQHGLHIDVTDELIKLASFTLIGYASADDFLSGLIESEVEQGEARKIIEEINQAIFIPIQQELRLADQKPVIPPPPPIPVPRYTPPVPQPAPQAAPRPQHFQLVNKLAPQPTPMPARPPAATPSAPPTPKGIQPDHMLPIGEGPVPPPAKAAVPPPNLPGAMPSSAPAVPVVPKPAAPLSINQISNRPAVQPPAPPKITPPPAPRTPAKPYSVDPYREPIDEDHQ